MKNRLRYLVASWDLDRRGVLFSVFSLIFAIPQVLNLVIRLPAVEDSVAERRDRVTRSDIWILIWLSFESTAVIALVNRGVGVSGVVGLGWFTIVKWSAVIRIVDVVQASANSVFFDWGRLSSIARIKDHDLQQPANAPRKVFYTFLNFLELLICFSVLYIGLISQLHFPKGELPTFAGLFYFSCVSQFTLGFGDILPSGDARLVVVTQVAIGLFFSILIIARAIAWLTQPGPER